MRVLETIDIELVQQHLRRTRSAVTLPYEPSEYEVYRAEFDESDVDRLVLWWQFRRRTQGASCRLADLIAASPPHRRTLSFIEGNPAKGYAGVDLRTAENLELVVVATGLHSDLLYIIDGNNRAVAQRLTHQSFQGVPCFLCVHPQINHWQHVPRHLRR